MKSSANEWMDQVRAWALSHPQINHVDDSRESIYDLKSVGRMRVKEVISQLRPRYSEMLKKLAE